MRLGVTLATLLVVAASSGAEEPPEAARPEAMLMVPAGSVLRSAPEPGAEALGVIQTPMLPLLERRGSWVRVGYPDLQGWIYLGAEPPAPATSGAARGAELERARGLLGENLREARLGPFPLWTDIQDRKLFDLLEPIAGQLAEAWSERSGLPPPAVEEWVVVIFDQRQDYLALRRANGLFDFAGTGHAGAGLVATYGGRRGRPEVAMTLLHELVHLCNWRVLGADLPLWLDEGLADDLTLARLDRRGGLVITPLDRRNLRYGPRLGDNLSQLLPRLADRHTPGLEDLLAMAPADFLGAERNLHYNLSMWWVRFLLEDDDLRPGLHAFLRQVAAGGDATPAGLAHHLPGEPRAWEVSWHRWLGQLQRRFSPATVGP